jgi:peptide deformylase
MIYPIVALGNPVLKERASEIELNHPELKTLINDMFETMYNASGVGLAAPQIGKSIRLFVIDAEPMDEEKLKGAKMVFINPLRVEEEGEPWPYEEGCLSIPGIREAVKRPEKITLQYHDEAGKSNTRTFEGMLARVIQHEYDHLEGKLFIDYLSPFRKKLIQNKLNDILKAKAKAEYPIRFIPQGKR